MPFALVEDERVAQIEDTSFEVAPPLHWEPATPDVTTEWTWDGAALIPPPVPSLAETKAAAKIDLGNYYRAYSSSQFVAGADTFSAAPEGQIAFLVISEVLRVDPTNTSQVVFDIDGDPHPVTNPTAWGQFWGKYVDLFDEARGVVGQAWQDVKAATTNAEVQAVLDTLPPIPGA